MRPTARQESIMKPSLILAMAVLTLGACAQREDPADVAAAQGDREATLRANEASAARATAKIEADAVTADDVAWSVTGDEGERTIAFGPVEGDALFTAQCDTTKREIVFKRAVRVGAGQIDMKVGTGAQIKVFQADAQNDPAPHVSGRLASTDPVVQAIAASSEPMSVQVGDGDMLLVPAGGLFKQLVEKCV
jgi:hypothetical protein